MTKKGEEKLKKMYIDGIKNMDLEEESKLIYNYEDVSEYFNLINDYDGHENDEDAEDYLVQYLELKENLTLSQLSEAAYEVAKAKHVYLYENFLSSEIEEFKYEKDLTKHFADEITKELINFIGFYFNKNKNIKKIIVDFLDLNEEESEEVEGYFDDADLSIDELLDLAIRIFEELNLNSKLLIEFKKSIEYHLDNLNGGNEILDYGYNVL